MTLHISPPLSLDFPASSFYRSWWILEWLVEHIWPSCNHIDDFCIAQWVSYVLFVSSPGNLDGPTPSNFNICWACLGHACKHIWSSLCSIHGFSQLLTWRSTTSSIFGEWGASICCNTSSWGNFLLLSCVLVQKITKHQDLPVTFYWNLNTDKMTLLVCLVFPQGAWFLARAFQLPN
jgi:hypothetical protein